MKIHKLVPIAVLAILTTSMLLLGATQVAYAKCYDPAGAPIPCPDKEKKVETPAPAATVVPTATLDLTGAGIMPPDRGQGSPLGLPAVQFGLIIAVLLGGGALLFWRRFKRDGSDQGFDTEMRHISPPGPPIMPGGDAAGKFIKGNKGDLGDGSVTPGNAGQNFGKIENELGKIEHE